MIATDSDAAVLKASLAKGETEEVRDQLRRQIESLALRLLGEPAARKRNRFLYDEGGILEIFTTGTQQGYWSYKPEGVGGDTLDLIGWIFGYETEEVLKLVRRNLGAWFRTPYASCRNRLHRHASHRATANQRVERSQAQKQAIRRGNLMSGTDTEKNLPDMIGQRTSSEKQQRSGSLDRVMKSRTPRALKQDHSLKKPSPRTGVSKAVGPAKPETAWQSRDRRGEVSRMSRRVLGSADALSAATLNVASFGHTCPPHSLIPERHIDRPVK